MPIFRLPIVLTAVLCTLSTQAWSQTITDPTGDPIVWLSRYLGGAACVVYEAGPSPMRMERVEENTEVQFDGCRMVLHQAAVIGAHSEVRKLTVDLAGLDATSVTLRDGFEMPAGWTSRGDVPTHTVFLTVPKGQPLIDRRVETFDGRDPLHGQERTVTILVRHETNATEIVRALTLAIEACRASHRP